MAGGRSPRQKGDRLERALVRLFEQYGIISMRVPQSGTKGGRFRDLLPLYGREPVVEVRHHGSSFRRLHGWLIDRDLLLIKANRKDLLVVLPLQLAPDEQAIPHLQGGRP
jgi:hypothetical protein